MMIHVVSGVQLAKNSVFLAENVTHVSLFGTDTNPAAKLSTSPELCLALSLIHLVMLNIIQPEGMTDAAMCATFCRRRR